MITFKILSPKISRNSANRGIRQYAESQPGMPLIRRQDFIAGRMPVRSPMRGMCGPHRSCLSITNMTSCMRRRADRNHELTLTGRKFHGAFRSAPASGGIKKWTAALLSRKRRDSLKFLVFLIIGITTLDCSARCAEARAGLSCADRFRAEDAFIVAGPAGEVFYKKNEKSKCIPASTLKILTGLAALELMGPSYRFKTEFFLDKDSNLSVKAFGDPLLISEAWIRIADRLSERIKGFKDLVLDDSYFSITGDIPGVGSSTNPYDAPVGALCANFNTIFFDRDESGGIISAEKSTPILPFSLKKIRGLGLKRGRYTFSHKKRDGARYAGELLAYFLKEKGVFFKGEIIHNSSGLKGGLVYTYRSMFTLEDAVQKMLRYSNNFMANQILIALGAHVLGPPGTLDKGIKVVLEYAKDKLKLYNIEIVEGSGISKQNRLAPVDMLTVLNAFSPYRHLMRKRGEIFYKTGSLTGIRTRAGYIQGPGNRLCPFFIFLAGQDRGIDSLVHCIKKSVLGLPR